MIGNIFMEGKESGNVCPKIPSIFISSPRYSTQPHCPKNIYLKTMFHKEQCNSKPKNFKLEIKLKLSNAKYDLNGVFLFIRKRDVRENTINKLQRVLEYQTSVTLCMISVCVCICMHTSPCRRLSKSLNQMNYQI